MSMLSKVAKKAQPFVAPLVNPIATVKAIKGALPNPAADRAKAAQDAANAQRAALGAGIDDMVRSIYGTNPVSPGYTAPMSAQGGAAGEAAIDPMVARMMSGAGNLKIPGAMGSMKGLVRNGLQGVSGIVAPMPGEGQNVGSDALSPNDPMLGGMNPDQSGQIGRNQRSILTEADLQKKLATETLTGQSTARKQQLSDLADLLNKSQQQQMSAQLPGIYEDLNSKGLLRSSALGNNLATQQANLAAQTSNQLAQQGLAYNDQAINGETGIQNAYLGQRTGALQRGFSLEDYANQLKAGKLLGSTQMPTAPSGPSGKGGALQGAASGAATGAMIGGGPGAAVGGGIGLLLGGK